MRSFLTLLAAILVLSSCGGDDSSVDAGDSSGTADTGALEGRQFLLQSETGFDLVEGTTISLRFDDGQLSADAGCNSLSGPYQLDGDTLVLSSVQMTEMGCDPPRHAQDEAFISLLSSSPKLGMEGDTLILESADVRMEFLDSKVADPDRALSGTTWQLDGFIDGELTSSLPAGVDANLTLDAESEQITIDGPCNDIQIALGADIAAELPSEGELQMAGEIVRTVKSCGEEIDALEDQVVAVFSGSSVEYAIDAASLTITSGDNGLTFRAAE